ncbi:DMT family transporter [Streptomyces albidoflavus]|uniref:DMT family transporter n=1 Tax=Streptomyces albidoflavus TaxID=1886 RepID=UPI0013EE9438|nr:multidrug efflux SMR transporter [Streptomyces albidoflavus]
MRTYPPRAWLLLAATVVLEVVATLALKASHGFREPLWGITAAGAYTATVVVLARTLRTIPMSIAYVMWTGAGTLGVALLGAVIFGDSLSVRSWVGVGLVVAGVMAVNAGKKSSGGENGPAEAHTQRP